VTISWFTVAAQVVNFLILVFLLHRFLYDPIVETMEKRQATIRTRLKEAESARHAAEAEAEKYRRKQRELDEQQTERLAKLRDEMAAERENRLQELRNETAELREQWHEALASEQDEFARELRSQLGREFFRLSRRALADLADAELEMQAAKVFMRHIREQDTDQWRAFVEEIHTKREPIVVRSAFELSPDLRREITHTLQGAIEADVDVRFEQEPSLISGLELQAHSSVAAWQLDDYLDELQARAQDFVQGEYGNGEHGNGHQGNTESEGTNESDDAITN
jgi:F-type H+-transporting ATPase subunit b